LTDLRGKAAMVGSASAGPDHSGSSWILPGRSRSRRRRP